MRRVKSFTSIWRVQRILYAVGDTRLPFPLPFAWIAWFVVTFFVMLTLGGFLSGLWRYGIIPAGIATIMGRMTFQGKRPDRFLRSVISYWLKPKLSFMGKTVKRRKMTETIRIATATTNHSIAQKGRNFQ